MLKIATLMLAICCIPLAALAAESGSQPAAPVDWQSWHASSSVTDLASLRRGAHNFMNYCNGCHGLKYVRYQRMADDLKISADVLAADLVAPGSNNLDYITAALPAGDAVNWFGKVTPDPSLTARSKGTDYIYRFLNTFYVDASSVTGSMTSAQYDHFVRDTVNFLAYVGEPAQIERRSMGIWVVLFLMLLTWLS